MRCARSRRLIGRALDARLDATEAAQLAAHIETCEPCRTEEASLLRTWVLLGALPQGAGVGEDWPAISARIADRQERQPWLHWPLAVRRAVGAGAIAGLAVVGLFLGEVAADAALGPGRSPSLEAIAIAEGFGDLPFGAPSPGLILLDRNGATR